MRRAGGRQQCAKSAPGRNDAGVAAHYLEEAGPHRGNGTRAGNAQAVT
jgi:hypothetical protein